MFEDGVPSSPMARDKHFGTSRYSSSASTRHGNKGPFPVRREVCELVAIDGTLVRFTTCTRKNNFFRYFPRLTGLSVVGLVGHSLLEGAVSLDVDNVTRLVALEVCAQVFYALRLVRTREHVPRATPISLRVRHLEGFVSPLRLDQTCEKYLHFIRRQKDRQVHS